MNSRKKMTPPGSGRVRDVGAYAVRYLFVICGFSSAEAAALGRYAKAKRQRDGFHIEIDKDKTPSGEQYLDPPGAELLAWF